MSSSDQRIEADVDDDLEVYTQNTPLVQQSQSAQGSASGSSAPPPPSQSVSGNMAGSHSGPHRQVIGGVALESRYGGSSTLDEPLSATLVRVTRSSAPSLAL